MDCGISRLYFFIVAWMVFALNAYADSGNVLHIPPCVVKGGANVGGCDGLASDPFPPRDIEQHKILEKEKLQKWFQWEKVSDTSIRVFFHVGDSGCYGNRAIMREDRERILIAVVEGLLPDGPEMCSLLGGTGSFLLHTENPIGGRMVLHLESVTGLRQ